MPSSKVQLQAVAQEEEDPKFLTSRSDSCCGSRCSGTPPSSPHGMIGDLTQTQFAAIAKLHEVGPCSQNQLGRLIYFDGATINGVVDRLSLRHLVTVVNDPIDRRRRAVALTPRGREIAEKALKEAGEITATTLSPLSREEQLQLTRLLKRIA